MLTTVRRAVFGQARRGLAQASPLNRFLSSLAILEQREGKLNTGSLSAITAAKQLGGPIHAFLAGSNIKGVAEEAAKVEGVEKVLAVDNGAYDRVSWPAHG
jgi:electron transfer flavoprotein alpha subunit